MRFKLDENLPRAAKDMFEEFGHQASTALGLGGASDLIVGQRAAEEERVLVTFDLDFGDARDYPPGSHPGIIVLRLADQRRDATLAVLRRMFETQDVEGFVGAIVVVTERLVRIHRQ